MKIPDLKVVPLRNGAPSLTDIPSLLRLLADGIEGGEMIAETMFVVIPKENEFPMVRGWGRVDGDRHPIVQLALAQQWLMVNQTERRP